MKTVLTKKVTLFLVLSSLMSFIHAEDKFDDLFGKAEKLFPDFFSEIMDASDAPEAEGDPKKFLSWFDSPIQDAVWCGEKRDTLFLLTQKGLLFRSKDDAFSGKVLTQNLKKIGKEQFGPITDEVGDITKMEQSPVDLKTIIFTGSEGISWITEDCGDNFRALYHGKPLGEIDFHPTERLWLLTSAWNECPEDAKNCKVYQKLMLSQNLGLNWTTVSDYVYQYSWGMTTNKAKSSAIPKERILLIHDPTQAGDQRMGNWKSKLQLSYSDDFFETDPIKILKGGNKLLVTENYMFVVQVRDEAEQDVTLLVANPNELKYTLRPIEVPSSHLLDHGYTILDASENSVVLHTDHSGEDSPFGNLYISDSTGVRYSLSMKGNVRNSAGQCDFEKIDGLEGVYLGNFYDPTALKNFQLAMRELEDAVPYQNSKRKGGDNVIGSAAHDKMTKTAKLIRELNGNKKTFISFDNGAIWKTLTPPVEDIFGERITCENTEEECSLHLHSISSTRFGPFYSDDSALGLVLGTGNVGSYLSNRRDEISTYLSRDGGSTWFEVAKGSHVYEIGDHGGLIVMAPNQEATTKIYYSWNQGLSFETLEISKKPIQVNNIIIEPTNTGEKFLIYGRELKGTKGVTVALDFTALHPRVCQGAVQPGSETSDYETWTPGGSISPKCLLGRQNTYIRRKRDAQCFNDESHSVWRTAQHCSCTEEDWECDFGFARQGAGPCMPVSGLDSASADAMKIGEKSQICQADGFYHITQGYRKVAGDSCVGGVDHSPVLIHCRGNIIMRNLNSLLMIAAIVLVYLWASSTNNKEKVKFCGQMMKDKLAALGRLFRRRTPESKGYSTKFPGQNKFDDDNNTGTNFTFDGDNEDESLNVDRENRDDDDEVRERRFTVRGAMEAARRHVPLLNGPTDKNKFDSLRGV